MDRKQFLECVWIGGSFGGIGALVEGSNPNKECDKAKRNGRKAAKREMNKILEKNDVSSKRKLRGNYQQGLKMGDMAKGRR